MAVDNNGSETGKNQRLFLQELHMMRTFIQQMNNPDLEPEKQTNLLKKQREKTQGQLSKRREGERDCPWTPSAVPLVTDRLTEPWVGVDAWGHLELPQTCQVTSEMCPPAPLSLLNMNFSLMVSTAHVARSIASHCTVYDIKQNVRIWCPLRSTG